MKHKIFSITLTLAGAFLLGIGIDYSSFFLVVPGIIMITLGAVNTSPDSKQ